MAESLKLECTELKRRYDGCFNKWFEGYVAIAAPSKPDGLDDAARTKSLKNSAAQFEKQCGAVFREYKACVETGIAERGIGDLLKEARDEQPLDVPADRYDAKLEERN